MRHSVLGLLTGTILSGPAFAAPIQTVFTIALENHNFTQPNPAGPPQQIFSNAAAPYINSLVTPNNANAKYVSYFSPLTNVAPGIEPPAPNDLWHKVGSN